jgi:hypothetical protein
MHSSDVLSGVKLMDPQVAPDFLRVKMHESKTLLCNRIGQFDRCFLGGCAFSYLRHAFALRSDPVIGTLPIVAAGLVLTVHWKSYN